MRTVGEVSRLAGVTIRTLRHYDEIGLLRPSGRTEAGYRLYGHVDLERLQEILIWRQLGFSLTRIQELLDDPEPNRLTALTRQRELVERDLDRLHAAAHALDEAIAAHRNGIAPEEKNMFEDFDPIEYEDEARERWGRTDAYKESARRAATYGDEEWAEIRSDADEIVNDFAALKAAGEAPTGDPAQALAKRHRQHITRWFYPVSTTMHRHLAEMYIADPRFTQSHDLVTEGLAAYMHDAIVANADAQDGLVSR